MEPSKLIRTVVAQMIINAMDVWFATRPLTKRQRKRKAAAISSYKVANPSALCCITQWQRPNRCGCDSGAIDLLMKRL